LRIAFVSYEFPPDTGVGGIATYVRQIATVFSQRNIHVEVICASSHRSGTSEENEFLNVTRIKCSGTEEFRRLSPSIVSERNDIFPIDMIEVPEYGAEGLHMKNKLPGIPLIVKLHTPKYLIKELNDHYYDQRPLRKLKSALVGYNKESDPEYKAILLADHIISPSRSLRKKVSEKWSIPLEKITHAPYPYFPSDDLSRLVANTRSNTVLYVGRLETRKGVYNLAKAVPIVLRAIPGANFIFLGKDSRGPRRERSMKEVMEKEIGDYISKVEFIDHIPLTEVPSVISRAGICVFPSLWENFPNVCLEAMTASRPVVASSEGGMFDMLEGINNGKFIDPFDKDSIANVIIDVLKDELFRANAARQNHEKAVNYYGKEVPDELVRLYSSFLKK
jgi:glycosyltransferase involved in cell wall biosynthesis